MYSICIDFLNADYPSANSNTVEFNFCIGNTTDLLEAVRVINGGEKFSIYDECKSHELCIFMVSEYNCDLFKMKVYDDGLSADTFYDRLFGNIMQRGGLTNGESDIYAGILVVAGAIQNAYNKGKRKEIEAASKEECKPIKFDAISHYDSSDGTLMSCYLMPDGTVRYSDTYSDNAYDYDSICNIVEAFCMFSYAIIDVGKHKNLDGVEYDHTKFVLWDTSHGRVAAEYMVLSMKDRFDNLCKRIKSDADDCDDMREVISRFADAFVCDLYEYKRKQLPSPFDDFKVLRNYMYILQDYGPGFDTGEAKYAVMGLVLSDATEYVTNAAYTDNSHFIATHNAFTSATDISFVKIPNIPKCYAVSTGAVLNVYYNERNIGPIFLWGGPDDESLTTFMKRLYIFAEKNDAISVPVIYNIMVYCRAFITEFIQSAANTNTLSKGARKEILDIIKTLELDDCL